MATVTEPARKKRKTPPSEVTIEKEEDLDKLLHDMVKTLTLKIQCDNEIFHKISVICGSVVESIHICPEYEDSNPKVLDTSDANFEFSQLKRLNMQFQALQSIHLDKAQFPQLTSFNFEQPCATDQDRIHLDLPELESLFFEHICVNDASDFGPSLSRCKKLRSLSCYKMWGLGSYSGVHILRCPVLETFNIYRSDDAEHFSIHSPRLEDVNIQACYSIGRVNVFPKKGQTYEVNHINADAPKGNILTNERCGEVHGTDDDPFSCLF